MFDSVSLGMSRLGIVIFYFWMNLDLIYGLPEYK